MKLELWRRPQEAEPVRVSIRQRCGGIDVFVANEDGDPKLNGMLMQLSSAGELWLPPKISSRFGFPLDDAGRLRLQNGCKP